MEAQRIQKLKEDEEARAALSSAATAGTAIEDNAEHNVSGYA